ncbi:gliding motility-associated ABC transporter permease subunit GldF [Flavobacteriaceae bacterium]|jgi:ABC-2 type transport system permease protein|nr:gliding motility-associated ABC transporter permease subunit GldF [Flavobacteriaceae bacterium]MDB2490844.1 gliding motility-associated ABC transporter permease subunit GldF [Flavobacteriaceae bacterium]|tara:strand:- start:537 stop:1256 length:720 start_codon:yes stop_codon:yes gene_type:complete
MLAILKKEFNSFFASSIAYLVIGVFLLVNGLFLWVFNDELNVLNAGFADLTSFFYFTPWLLLFLVPAITMKTFSDEFQTGTIEILKTKPITNFQIVLGKFFAVVLLIMIAIIPTFTYVYSINQLGNPIGNIDYGSTIGSYTGLFLLASSFASIGIFSSSITKNQIAAFLTGALIIFFFYFGFDAVANLFGSLSYAVKLFGMNEHFKSISRGVLDTRDILYFFSIIVFFLFITKQKLTNE